MKNGIYTMDTELVHTKCGYGWLFRYGLYLREFHLELALLFAYFVDKLRYEF